MEKGCEGKRGCERRMGDEKMRVERLGGNGGKEVQMDKKELGV